MKIAVLHRYPPEQVIGTNASFLHFLKILSDRGHEVYYVTYKDKADFPVIRNLKYIILPFYFNRGNNRDKILKTYLWILIVPFYALYLQTMKKLDLVYCDDSVPYYGFLSKMISPFSEVIIRLGDLQVGYSLAGSHPNLYKLALAVEIFIWKTCSGIIPISQEFKDFLSKLGIAESKLRVVEESINLDEPTMEKCDSQTTRFMFHGALVSCKGLSILLDSFAKLKEEFPDISLVIAGDGPEKKMLVEKVSYLALKGVEFTGWYNHKMLGKLMKNVDLSIVMRSQNPANNFVVTTCLLENWKYRKPVIVPNLKSFNAVVTENLNGIYFEPGNSNSLYQAMRKLYLERYSWNLLAENGLRSAREHFYYKDIAEKMVNVLEFYGKN